MNKYETVVVFHPDLNQQGLDGEIVNIRKLLENHGAKELVTEDWGRKELAHKSKKQRWGRYVCYRYASEDHQVVNGSNAVLRITSSVLKFQSHKISDRKPKFRGNPLALNRQTPGRKGEDFDFEYSDN
jgi:ribosomal protein S6